MEYNFSSHSNHNLLHKDKKNLNLRKLYYGKIFDLNPWLEKSKKNDKIIDSIIDSLVDFIKKSKVPNRPLEEIPAGYTYLGQFIAHDVSFDSNAVSSTPKSSMKIINFNKPFLDLDSIYGNGRLYHLPILDEKNKFRIDYINTKTKKNKKIASAPRYKTQNKVLGDIRNGEHIIISQLFIAFYKFHNKLVDKHRVTLKKVEPKIKEENIKNRAFEKAKKELTWHYQWLVVNDYLPRFVKKSVINKILKNKGSIYNYKDTRFLPLEFSAAIFRFGHSMVKGAYRFSSNENHKDESLREFLTNPPEFIDWRNFFFKRNDDVIKNFANPISPNLTTELEEFEEENNFFKSRKLIGENLAKLNLKTGYNYGLPSGQSIATKIFGQGDYSIPNLPDDFKGNTPLWLYVLCEAHHKNQGKKLGPVGELILAEVLIGLIQGDTSSYLSKEPDWVPPTGIKDFSDFLKYAEVYEGAFQE